MSDRGDSPRAQGDTVQPSLWDRLIDDLPGLEAETGHLRRELTAELGEERLDALLLAGEPAIRRDTALDHAIRRDLLHLLAAVQRKQALSERGIVVTAAVLREAVRRDIEALFNTERLEAEYLFADGELRHAILDDLSDFPEVRKSVVNYGMPAFSGKTERDFDRVALARSIRDILAVYEPRLKQDTIRVRVTSGARTGLRIEIDAVLMMAPVPERLRLATEIDLDSGAAVTALGTR